MTRSLGVSVPARTPGRAGFCLMYRVGPLCFVVEQEREREMGMKLIFLLDYLVICSIIFIDTLHVDCTRYWVS